MGSSGTTQVLQPVVATIGFVVRAVCSTESLVPNWFEQVRAGMQSRSRERAYCVPAASR